MANDHQKEIEFFSNELGCRRKDVYHIGSVSWISSWIYFLLSNYGKSILTPISIWVLLTAFSSFTYLDNSTNFSTNAQGHSVYKHSAMIGYEAILPTEPKIRFWLLPNNDIEPILCHNSPYSLLESAIQISVITAVPITSPSNKIMLDAAYECLFSDLPPSKAVHWMFAQKLLSVILVFLIFLGIRNRFKLK